MIDFVEDELHPIGDEYYRLFEDLGLPIIKLANSNNIYTFRWLHRVWDYTVFKPPEGEKHSYEYDWECIAKLYKDETFRIVATAINSLFNNYKSYAHEALPSLFNKLGISDQISSYL